MKQSFDLNIETILENWDISDAVREIIANALDEKIITNSKEIEIKKENDCWHIRDYGRGLRYNSLTQNENCEKLNDERLIGKFGIGLKDAIATFYRHNVGIVIRSKYNTIRVEMLKKADFSDIKTLHALIYDPDSPYMEGTDVELTNCPEEEIEKAKNLFLVFNEKTVLEDTRLGQVLEKDTEEKASIYLYGLKVAEETNFLFSYNITHLSQSQRRTITRERKNIGRATYMKTVRDILKIAESEYVKKKIANECDLGRRREEIGNSNEMLKYAFQLKAMMEKDNIVFVSEKTLTDKPDLIGRIKSNGKTPIQIPEEILRHFNSQNRNRYENPYPTERIFEEENRPYIKEYIHISDLNEEEKKNYNKTEEILSLIGGKPVNVQKIIIAELSYKDCSRWDGYGYWDRRTGEIIIARPVLKDLSLYSGTLIHECCHAQSGADDATRAFEAELTRTIGKLIKATLE